MEQFYYGMNTGLMISVVAVSLLSRHLEEENDPLRRATAVEQGAPTAGSVAGTVRAARAVRLGEWQSPAANDGAFATQMLRAAQQVGSSGKEKPASFQFSPSFTN